MSTRDQLFETQIKTQTGASCTAAVLLMFSSGQRRLSQQLSALLSGLFSPCRRNAAAPPSSRPPEGGAQLAFGRTDLSALQRRLKRGKSYISFSFLSPACLPLELFRARSTGMRPRGRPRTPWRD